MWEQSFSVKYIILQWSLNITVQEIEEQHISWWKEALRKQYNTSSNPNALLLVDTLTIIAMHACVPPAGNNNL